MRNKILFSLIFTCLYVQAFSQAKTYIYYFDPHLNSIEKSKSELTGRGTFVNGLLNMDVKENVTNRTVLVVHFTDTTLNEYQGLYQAFYLNGRKNIEGMYEKGNMNGVWIQWDSSGRVIDSTTYDQGQMKDSTRLYYYASGLLMTHDFTDAINDKKIVTNYNDSGRLVSEIRFTGQTGVRKSFKNGAVLLDTLYSRREDEATFPGGDYAWSLLIKKTLENHIDELIADGKSGTCTIRFIIEKDGSVNDVEAKTMKGTKLSKVAINAIKHGPKWNPAVQYGKNVKAFREQPVSFALSDK